MNNNKSRKLISEELVVASHNPGKVAEIENLLSEFNIVSISALDIGLVEPEENGSTFLENATIKALSAAITSRAAQPKTPTGFSRPNTVFRIP